MGFSPLTTMQPMTPRSEYLSSFAGHYRFEPAGITTELGRYSAPSPSNPAVGTARAFLKMREKSAAHQKAACEVARRQTEIAATMLALRSGSLAVPNGPQAGGMDYTCPKLGRSSMSGTTTVGRPSNSGARGSNVSFLRNSLSVASDAARSDHRERGSLMVPDRMLMAADEFEEPPPGLPMVLQETEGRQSPSMLSASFERSCSLSHSGVMEGRAGRPRRASVSSMIFNVPSDTAVAVPPPRSPLPGPRRASMNVGSRQSADQAGDVASRTNASMTDFQRRLSLAYKQNRSMRGMNAPASHVVTVEPPAKIRDTPYQKFRRVARMVAHSVHFVKFLARILKNPIEWSWEYDPKTYSEDDVSHSTSLSDSKTKGHASGIPLLMSHEIFGVSHLFMKPKKFQGWLDNDMRSLFRKKPQNRTKHDLDIMATWCSTMKCMEKYPTSVQRALLGAAIYTRWNSSRQICKESHPVGRFYMILDGEVEISKIDRAKVIGARNKTMALASHITSRRMTVASDASDPRATTANLELVKEEPVNSAAVQAAIDARQATAEGLAARRNARAAVGEEGAPVASLTEEEMMEDAKAVKQIEDDLNKAYTITMGYMGAGESFDIAFLTTSTRTNTYTTNRITEFLTISKRDYENIMSTFKEAESVKQDMLRKHPVFKSLNGDLATLIHCCVIKKFDANRAVVCQGTHSGSIFFVVSGTCRVIQSVNFVKKDLSKRMFRIDRLSDYETVLQRDQEQQQQHQQHSNPIPLQAGDGPVASTMSLATAPFGSGNFLGTDQSTPLSPPPPLRPSSSPTLLPPGGGSGLPPHCRIITELLVVRRLSPGDFFGQSLPMLTGTPAPGSANQPQLRPSSTTVGSTHQYTSVVTNEKCTVLQISKLDFHRLATDQTWRYLREDAAKYPLPAAIESAYLDKRAWNMAKKRIISEIVKSKRMKERRRDQRDPYGLEGDGRLAWAV